MHKHRQEIEEVQTWRELLGKVAARSDERQRIAAALRINTITISRWVAGSSKPRIETLRALPQALPKQSEQMITLLKLEYPDLFTNGQIIDDIESAIPHGFYGQVLNTYAMDPERLRVYALGSAILRQIIFQFDSDNKGFAIFIAQCVPPGFDRKVRSLRIIIDEGGPSTINPFRNQTCFCGAESQAGMAVQSAHMVVIQNPEDVQRIIIPDQQITVSGSSLALPLLRYDSSAGSVWFVSPQKNFFTPDRISLLKHYANLLTIAFEPHEFYPLSSIHLTMMPARSQQHPLLSTLQKRITDRMLAPLSESLPLSRLQAEQQIIKETEEELIQLSLTAEPRSEAFIR